MTAVDTTLPSRVAYVALGSNMGDRAGYLAFARTRMAALPGSSVIGESSIEETAPLGDIPQGPYLNQMVALRTSLAVEELLDHLHAIEREAGRIRGERWGPRTLDLDVVDVEGESRRDGRVLLPHPGLPARDFWQRELAELRSGAMRAAIPAASVVSDAHDVELPAWAVVSEARRRHIARVAALLDRWAVAMKLDPAERAAWRDAGRWHDALRDADEATLRGLVPASGYSTPMLHGPAAAARLEAEGESRADVLEAIRHHTVGHPAWSRTGRALYMADYLEPGRTFARDERAALAARVPEAFDAVFRTVVRQRIEWALRGGKALYPECVAMWNDAR